MRMRIQPEEKKAEADDDDDVHVQVAARNSEESKARVSCMNKFLVQVQARAQETQVKRNIVDGRTERKQT